MATGTSGKELPPTVDFDGASYVLQNSIGNPGFLGVTNPTYVIWYICVSVAVGLIGSALLGGHRDTCRGRGQAYRTNLTFLNVIAIAVFWPVVVPIVAAIGAFNLVAKVLHGDMSNSSEPKISRRKQGEIAVMKQKAEITRQMLHDQEEYNRLALAPVRNVI